MANSLFDVLKDFSTDLQAQSGLPPIAMSDIPTDSASMRFVLSNPDSTPLELSGSTAQLTGEINVQISHAKGTSDFTMFELAASVVAIYTRPYKFGSVQVTSSRVTSCYASESHQHVNVIINWLAIAA